MQTLRNPLRKFKLNLLLFSIAIPSLTEVDISKFECWSLFIHIETIKVIGS